MKQVDKLSIVEDIEVEYKKFYNECKKKHTEVKSGIDAGLNVLAHLRTLTIAQLEVELKNSIDDLLAPIILASQKQIKKLYVSSLAIIKKLVSYGLITQKHSNGIITVLKDILTNSSEEFVQIKVIETLLPMVDPSVIQLSENLVNNVMTMCLKFFSFKSIVFKNPLSALLKQLMNTVFGFLKDSLQPVVDKALRGVDTKMNIGIQDNNSEAFGVNEQNNNNNDDNKLKQIDEIIAEEPEEKTNVIESNAIEDNVIEPPEPQNHDESVSQTTSTLIDLSEYEDTEVYRTAFYLFNTICDLCEGVKNPIISTSIYSKCLGYELLSSILSITQNLFTYLPAFLTRITSSLLTSLSKSFPSSYDYPTCSKLCRLTVQIISNLSVNFSLIPYMIKYSETTSINWQKQIGIESIGAIFSCRHLLMDLFASSEDTYADIINTITKISYATALNKKGVNDLENGATLESTLQNKIINNVTILSDSETAPTTTHATIFVLIINAYMKLKDSYIEMLNDAELKLSEKNISEFTAGQNKVKNIICYKNDTIIAAMLALVQSANDACVIDAVMDVFVDYVKIFGCLDMKDIRNEYLKEINNLIGCDNPVLVDKAMRVVLKIFEENVGVLDQSGFACLIEALMKINVKIIASDYNITLNPNEEFEIEVYIKYIEDNVAKYSKGNQYQSIITATPGESNQMETKQVQNNEKTEEEKTTNPNTVTPTETPTPITPHSGGGIFSKIKSAFGFMRKAPPKQNNELSDDKKKEALKHLNSLMESLFIVHSPSFSDDVIIDIITALHSAVNNQTETLPVDHVANLHFILFKFLEICIANSHRMNLIWEIFSSSAMKIASHQIKNVSHFSVDLLSITAMFIINRIELSNPRIQLSNQNENFTYDNYQSSLIKSLINIANKNISQDINLNIIYDTNFFICNVNKEINVNGWSSLFSLFISLIKYNDEAQCENSFMLIEAIFTNYFDLLSLSNIAAICDLLEGFATYKKNDIVSKSALKLFVIACNLCEKFIEFVFDDNIEENENFKKLSLFHQTFFISQYDNVEKRKKLFDDIWKSIFYKVLNLSCDARVNLRKTSIETFTQIYLLKNKLISPETAIYIIKDDFFAVFDKINAIYEEKLRFNRKMVQISTNNNETNNNEKQNEIFASGNGSNIMFKFGEFQVGQLKLPERKKTKFTAENVSAPTTDEVNWEATLQCVIQSLSSVISAFLQTNTNLGFDFYRDQIFSLIANKFANIMQYTSPKIIISILQCIKTICDAYPELFYKNIDMFYHIYEEMSIFISSEYAIAVFSTLMAESQMVRYILENLQEMFISETALSLNKTILSKEKFSKIITVLKSLISSAYTNECVTAPFNLLHDEANVFDFCNEIQKILISFADDNATLLYAAFLSSYMKINLNDIHSEALCRKAIDMFVKFFTNENLQMSVVIAYLPTFIDEVRGIICLRNNMEYVAALLREGKGEIQLWHYASNAMIKVLKSIITVSNKTKYDISILWTCVISAYEYVFKQSEGGYKLTSSKKIQDELIKSCQEMEIEIINFIVNGLLPNSLHIAKEMQIKLLNLLDMGSNFDYAANALSSTSTITSSISKVCISNLFELCKYKTEDALRREVNNFDADEYVQIKVKIAKMCTPILIKRCKETLKKFLEDEIKSGSMPLSRSRLEDIKFVLEKLKNLNIYPNYNRLDNQEAEPKEMMDFILMKKKSHLISLLPLLSEFITTKENEIKIIVKDIFRIISEEIGIK